MGSPPPPRRRCCAIQGFVVLFLVYVLAVLVLAGGELFRDDHPLDLRFPCTAFIFSPFVSFFSLELDRFVRCFHGVNLLVSDLSSLSWNRILLLLRSIPPLASLVAASSRGDRSPSGQVVATGIGLSDERWTKGREQFDHGGVFAAVRRLRPDGDVPAPRRAALRGGGRRRRR
jgi:hypothetical protein